MTVYLTPEQIDALGDADYQRYEIDEALTYFDEHTQYDVSTVRAYMSLPPEDFPELVLHILKPFKDSTGSNHDVYVALAEPFRNLFEFLGIDDVHIEEPLPAGCVHPAGPV